MALRKSNGSVPVGPESELSIFLDGRLPREVKGKALSLSYLLHYEIHNHLNEVKKDGPIWPNRQTTHYITSVTTDDPNGPIDMTYTQLMAVALRIPIVSGDWIVHSHHFGKLLSAEPYRLYKDMNCNQLFLGLNFFVADNFKNTGEVEELLKLLGANVSTGTVKEFFNLPGTKFLVVPVYDLGKTVLSYMKYHVIGVSPWWIINSVHKCERQPIREYLTYPWENDYLEGTCGISKLLREDTTGERNV